MQTDLPQSGPALELEFIACPLCGSVDSAPQVEAADPASSDRSTRYLVVRCGDCGLSFTNPRPTRATIAAAYRPDYGPHARQPSSSGARRRGWWSRRMARWRRRRQLDWHGEGRLLDFGCGSGSFLERMHAEGWQVVGLDASARVVEHIRANLRVPALAGTLPHPELKPESFDVITMWQALEHVHDPLEVLRSARRLLVPGGRLVLSVPNMAGAPPRWFGPDWFGWDLPRHLTHFTPETLQRLVEQAGFRTERLEFVGHATWLEASARRIRDRGCPLGWRRFLLVRKICRAVAWISVLRGVSDAMMLTAVTDGAPASGPLAG